MPILVWLRRPRQLAARLRYWVWEKRNPDKPWLTPAAVAFLEGELRPPMAGFEFGSGRSTRWYAERLGQLTSVEHDPTWHGVVRGQLAGLPNVDYRLVPLDHPEAAPEAAAYDPMPAYVRAVAGSEDAALDFVVVDGHYRSHCVRAALPKLKPGGLLLVDDVNLWPNRAGLPVPADWPVVHASTNGIKWTNVWRKPAATP